MMTLYKIIKTIENRAPEILFVIFMGTLGYAIYLLEWGLVQ
tara:strand:+ start:5700 stop:5822 length:123 start_codon:yes stop_codon:yes gene_type:complete